MRLYPQLSGPRNSQILRDVLVAVALVLLAVFAWWVRRAVLSLTAISTGFTDSAQSAQDTWTSLGDSLGGIPLLGDELEKTVDGLAAATFGNAAQTGHTITTAVTLAANVLGFATFAAPAAVLLVLWLPRRIDRAQRWDAAHRVLSAVAVSPVFAGAIGAEPGPTAIGTHDTLALPQSGGAAGPAPGSDLAEGGATRAWPRAGFRDVVRGPNGDVDVSFPPDELLALRALCNLPLEDLARFTPRPFEAFASGDYAPLVAALYAHEGLVPPGWSERA